jgi:hypothetical protein
MGDFDFDLMLVAYWIDGPRGSELLFCTDSHVDRIAELSEQQGYSIEDYTVTELYAKAYPGPEIEVAYTVTAVGREILEQSKK